MPSERTSAASEPRAQNAPAKRRASARVGESEGGSPSVYLDYHATTPVDSRVLDAMLPFFTERFGNPHSKQHAWGWDARDAVEAARAQVAALINASANEITFTSGASE